MKSLGWNTPKNVLEARAKEVLRLANSDNHSDIRVPFLYGSEVEISFPNVESGLAVATRVQGLKKTFHEDREVGLYQAETKEERGPRTLVGAIARAVDNYTSTGEEPKFEFCKSSRRFYGSEAVIGRLSGTSISWEGTVDKKHEKFMAAMQVVLDKRT